MTKTLLGDVKEDLVKRRRLLGRIWRPEVEPVWVSAWGLFCASVQVGGVVEEGVVGRGMAKSLLRALSPATR